MNQVDSAARTFGLTEGEGESRWWMGGLATVKATGKETDGRYTLIEVFEPEGEGHCTCTIARTRLSGSSRES
jgi:hypothetical protein